MSKIPRDPSTILEQFADDCRLTFGDDLISVILFGSAARGEYVYKKSDINFLIVLTENGIKNLDRAFQLIKKWRKSRVSTPLILTEQYIESALDTFPIEFLTMKLHHKLIHGKNVLEGLNIDKSQLRLQCERELRGKLIHLQESYLSSLGNYRILKLLLLRSLPTYTSIFTALLHLRNIPIPGSGKQIISATANNFGLNLSVFEKISMIRSNGLKLKKDEMNQLAKQYIEQIRKLVREVDKL